MAPSQLEANKRQTLHDRALLLNRPLRPKVTLQIFTFCWETPTSLCTPASSKANTISPSAGSDLCNSEGLKGWLASHLNSSFFALFPFKCFIETVHLPGLSSLIWSPLKEMSDWGRELQNLQHLYRPVKKRLSFLFLFRAMFNSTHTSKWTHPKTGGCGIGGGEVGLLVTKP